jgi:hypothetical protein
MEAAWIGEDEVPQERQGPWPCASKCVRECWHIRENLTTDDFSHKDGYCFYISNPQEEDARVGLAAPQLHQASQLFPSF